MRRNKISKDLLLLLLAVVFSVALMFAFIELPGWLDGILQGHVGFPGFDQGADEESALLSDMYIDAYYLRWIGYGSLILVAFFILMGFLTRRSSWGWAGAFVVFLPVFAQFAYSMFFLSGLGILRTGWLPFIESGFPLLDLGKVIYIPFWVLMWCFGLFNWYAYDFICWLFMSIGAFLFVWGVFVWLQSRFGGTGVATSWIYKISRHPQYLGWIIWSYGLMLFSMPLNDMKKSWGYGNSFPWLIMTMVILAICMMEELTMKRQYGEAYDKYRDSTPFLFPLPAWLKKIFKAPMRLVTKSRFPENRRQIAGVIGIYTVIFMIISTIWIDFDHHGQLEVAAFENPQLVVDSLVDAIEHTKERRVLSGHFTALGKLGQNALTPLLNYLTDPDPVKREFAANQLGHIKDTSAVWPLIATLDDPVWRIRRSTLNALGEIGDARAAQPVFNMMANAPAEQQPNYFGIMATFKVKEAWPYIVDGLQDEKWYQRNAAIQALVDIDADRALPYVYRMLEDSNYRIRRKAVFVLLDLKPHDAVVPLQQVLDDEDFETRFYARQTIQFIEDNKP